jgi:GTP-binding protein Era
MGDLILHHHPNHKAGFVSIVGKPNVGKSTLMNQLVGERLSIITAKAQTTRHRIMGILTGKEYQIVYSDTPGILKPKYELHKAMMRFVQSSLEDADVILWVLDLTENEDDESEEILNRLAKTSTPIFLLMNKADLASEEQKKAKQNWINKAKNTVQFAAEFMISAAKSQNLDTVFQKILEYIPVHPPFYPEDELTDRTERFFASEIIREKIFLNYTQEIPYSCEVMITQFKEKEDILVISAEILVERATQKGIIIGKGGESLKKLGIQARQDLEAFWGRKVFLEQHVKVEADWRKHADKLSRFGYNQ